MPSAVTRIQDVIVPEIFAPYIINRTMELSAFWTSGVVGPAGAEIQSNVNKGGYLIHMPFWNDLYGRSQLLSDTESLITNKITAAQDVAVQHYRGNAWSSNDLAAMLAGDDPMRAIGNLVAAYWSRDFQATLLLTLKGAFAAANMTDNILDISGNTGDAAQINGRTFIDAQQRLGDAKAQLTAVAMHSAVESHLAKNDLIVTERDSTGRALFNTFMGKRVIVDDGMPVAGDVFTSYLFAAGAIGYAAGNPRVAVETDRDSLAGEDILVNRQTFVLHPRGIKWQGDSTGVTPSDAEMSDGDNWIRVYESKQIRMVQFQHKITV